jgi:hypothetical protein
MVQRALTAEGMNDVFVCIADDESKPCHGGALEAAKIARYRARRIAVDLWPRWSL